MPTRICVGAVGNPVHGPGRGDLGDGLGAEGQPFLAEPEDQDADRLAVRHGRASSSVLWFIAARIQAGRVGQPSGPIGQISLGGRAVEEGPRGRGEDRTVAAVNETYSAPGSSDRRIRRCGSSSRRRRA